MSTRTEDAGSKAPHKKLQNDVAGIDEDFGSIYVIPAPGDFVDDEANLKQTPPPHQLVTFGPNQEKLLIIPDYRVHHVVPGVAVKPLISSDKMVKIESKKAEKKDGNGENESSSNASNSSPPSSLASPPSATLSLRKDFVALLSSEFQEQLGTVSSKTPITALTKFNGPEGVILLDMFEGWSVNTLGDLSNFPATNQQGVELLKDADMFIDVEAYCANVAALIQLSPPISPNDFLKSSTNASASSQIEAQNSGASHLSTSPNTATSAQLSSFQSQSKSGSLSGAASKPISELSGITEQVASVLYRTALINTILDLANFPTRFPGIYGVLKLTNQIPNLDELIAAATSSCGINASSAANISASGNTTSKEHDLSASTHLNHLGEKQSSNVPIKDISSKTLVGVLDGMSLELANLLAVQLPPINTLSALATFADVNPSEYTYIVRQYPELADLSQQAALLVSVASGREKASK